MKLKLIATVRTGAWIWLPYVMTLQVSTNTTIDESILKEDKGFCDLLDSLFSESGDCISDWEESRKVLEDYVNKNLKTKTGSLKHKGTFKKKSWIPPSIMLMEVSRNTTVDMSILGNDEGFCALLNSLFSPSSDPSHSWEDIRKVLEDYVNKNLKTKTGSLKHKGTFKKKSWLSPYSFIVIEVSKNTNVDASILWGDDGFYDLFNSLLSDSGNLSSGWEDIRKVLEDYVNKNLKTKTGSLKHKVATVRTGAWIWLPYVMTVQVSTNTTIDESILKEDKGFCDLLDSLFSESGDCISGWEESRKVLEDYVNKNY